MTSPEILSVNPEKATRHDLRVAQRAVRTLKRVTSALETPMSTDLNFCVRPKKELSDLQSQVYKQLGYGKSSSSVIPRSSITVAKTEEATGIYYGTSNFLERRSHRFILNEDGGLSYHREPFDVDCQKIPSHRLDLPDLASIAANPEAMEELVQLSSDLDAIGSEGWSAAGRIAFVGC